MWFSTYSVLFCLVASLTALPVQEHHSSRAVTIGDIQAQNNAQKLPSEATPNSHKPYQIFGEITKQQVTKKPFRISGSAVPLLINPLEIQRALADITVKQKHWSKKLILQPQDTSVEGLIPDATKLEDWPTKNEIRVRMKTVVDTANRKLAGKGIKIENFEWKYLDPKDELEQKSNTGSFGSNLWQGLQRKKPDRNKLQKEQKPPKSNSSGR